MLISGLRHRIQPHPLPVLGVFANRARTYARQPTKAAAGWIGDVRMACEQTSRQNNIDVRFMDTWIPDRASLRDAITNRATPDELVVNFRSLWKEISRILK